MSEKKYEFTKKTEHLGITLHQIKAIKDFGIIKKGDIGGWIEKEENLSHYNDCWVYENARVYGDACVCGNARIMSDNDYATISNFGSQNRITTFQMCKDDIVRVRCGCFWGTINEFRNKVKETHKDSYLAQEYLMIADLMEFRFNNRQNKGRCEE